ncbi:hypothetical protein PTW35_09010 [Photobacterium sp. DA100]|uniref:hypothetical protein n=1 Tax=Photobacterium sp. DA100 TaxID=3027472 RepID=UPI002478AB6E|nr:hypothetical protein [Photobacterium sp. DA100]WEM43896.1 hypothetical protein PTW35_09010 [Photobacterium sp. DA100]
MYLLELFSDKNDQVKLVTFLLSALLAVLVLLLNQYFSQRRVRQEYLLKKIEELAQFSIEYTDLCAVILDDIRDQAASKHIEHPEVSDEHRRKVLAVIRKMELIVGLYFKGSGFDPNDYYLWNMQILEALEKGNFSEEDEVHILFQDARQHIVDSDAKLAVLCSKLVTRYGHKT